MGPLPVLFPPQAKFPPAAVRQILHCLSLWSCAWQPHSFLFEFNSSWSIVVKQGLYCASKEGDHSILPARVAPSERSFNAPTSSNWISSRISFVRSSLFPLVNRATSRCLVRASSCYAASNSFALTTHFRHQETLYATSCSSVHCMCFSSAARSSFWNAAIPQSRASNTTRLFYETLVGPWKSKSTSKPKRNDCSDPSSDSVGPILHPNFAPINWSRNCWKSQKTAVLWHQHWLTCFCEKFNPIRQL